MRVIFSFLALITSLVASSQLPFPEPSGVTAYLFPFYNGIQMIEIDHVASHRASIAWQDAIAPRNTPWEFSMPLMSQNEIVFVNADFEVVKKFNTNKSDEELLQIISAATTVAMKSHKARTSQWQIETPWFRSSNTFEEGYYKIFSSPFGGNERRYGRFKDNAFGLQGVIDSLGNVIFDMKYQNILSAGKHFLVWKDNYCGILDLEEKVVLPMIYTDASHQQIKVNSPQDELILFYQGDACYIKFNTATSQLEKMIPINFYQRTSIDTMIIFTYKNKFGVLNNKFDVILNLEYDYIEKRVQKDYFVVNSKGKWGAVNAKNEVVIPLEYDEYLFYQMGISLFRKGENIFAFENGALRKANEMEANRLNQSIENRIYASFIKGHPIVKQDHRYGILDSNLQVVVPIIYSKIIPIEWYNSKDQYFQKAVIAEIENRKGIIDLRGEVLLPFLYNEIQTLNSNNFSITRNNKTGICDSTFRVIIPCDYHSIYSPILPNQFVFSHNNSKFGVYKSDHTILIPEIFDRVNGYYNDYYTLEQGGKQGLADTTGKIIVSLSYDRLALCPFNELLLFEKNQKWGVMDLDENVLIPEVYDLINIFQKNITGVKKGDKWAFVNSKGKLKSQFIYDHISYSWDARNLVKVIKNGKVGFVDETLKEVIPCIYDDCVGYNRDGYHMIKDKKDYWINP